MTREKQYIKNKTKTITRATHRKSKIFECDRKSLCDLSTFDCKLNKSKPLVILL